MPQSVSLQTAALGQTIVIPNRAGGAVRNLLFSAGSVSRGNLLFQALPYSMLVLSMV